MEKLNGYYVDNNNNRWDCNRYTEEQAEKNSKSLRNCSDCSDCFGCSHCSHCSDCYHCFGCSDCYDCSRCSDCYDCSRCSLCSDCSGCSHCYHCSDCSHCSDYKSNPMRLCRELEGTTKALAQVYWLGDDVQCRFGCWKGNSIQEFRDKTKEQLVDSKKAKEFYKFLDVVECAIKELNK